MKLTIITINRNNADGLQKTIDSVFTQSITDFEYIIIDGASTDNSLQILQKYNDLMQPQLSYLSEPDTGIYNAMNKGIMKASGDYLLFLNSGDWLYDEHVIRDFYLRDYKADLIAGNLMNWDNKLTNLRAFPVKTEDLFFLFYTDTGMAHQATFINRKLFLQYGLYDERYKYVSDWAFFVKVLFLDNCSFVHFDRIISFYDLSGVTAQEESQKELLLERQDVLNNNLPLISKSFSSVLNENIILKSHEYHYNQFIQLKKGKFSLLLKVLIKLNRLFE